MESALVATKLHVPAPRSGLIGRARLIDRLERGLASRLVLVSAPAGFGKTSLLTQWLAAVAGHGHTVAWLALDQSDNRAPIFWPHLVAAVKTAVPGFGADLLPLLEASGSTTEGVLAALVNELDALSGELYLVLDDYHLIDDQGIQEGVTFLLEHLPAHAHLLITTRADPPLPLARLRARGDLVEIRAADLRFTPEEASTYLNEVMGLDLRPEAVDALETRTEGWIAALQLAALSMQGRDDVAGFIAGFTGNDRYIVDYLVEEVLARQPDEIRSFLLRTSILDQLSGPLCDAVTGCAGGKAMLERLERANLLVIPLDDRRRWYRYHHLFADVLRAHLEEEQPEQIPRPAPSGERVVRAAGGTLRGHPPRTRWWRLRANRGARRICAPGDAQGEARDAAAGVGGTAPRRGGPSSSGPRRHLRRGVTVERRACWR